MFHVKRTNVVGEDDGSHRCFTAAAYAHQQDLESSCEEMNRLEFSCNTQFMSYMHDLRE